METIWCLAEFFLLFKEPTGWIGGLVVTTVWKELEYFTSDTVFCFVVNFDFFGYTDALATVWCPVNFLMLKFAIADVEAFSTEGFSLFATKIAMNPNKILWDILILVLLHDFTLFEN